MSWESPTPSTMPATNAPTETNTVSSAMIVATRPRRMPSTWYRPNSFLRRFIMKLLAYTIKKAMTPAKKYVR